MLANPFKLYLDVSRKHPATITFFMRAGNKKRIIEKKMDAFQKRLLYLAGVAIGFIREDVEGIVSGVERILSQ